MKTNVEGSKKPYLSVETPALGDGRIWIKVSVDTPLTSPLPLRRRLATPPGLLREQPRVAGLAGGSRASKFLNYED